MDHPGQFPTGHSSQVRAPGPPVLRPQQGRHHRPGQPLARRHPRRGRDRRRPDQDLPGLPLPAHRQAPRQQTRPGRRRQLPPHHHLASPIRPRRALHWPGARLAWPPGLRRKRQLVAELERLCGKKVTLHDAAWHPPLRTRLRWRSAGCCRAPS